MASVTEAVTVWRHHRHRQRHTTIVAQSPSTYVVKLTILKPAFTSTHLTMDSFIPSRRHSSVFRRHCVVTGWSGHNHCQHRKCVMFKWISWEKWCVSKQELFIVKKKKKGAKLCQGILSWILIGGVPRGKAGVYLQLDWKLSMLEQTTEDQMLFHIYICGEIFWSIYYKRMSEVWQHQQQIQSSMCD